MDREVKVRSPAGDLSGDLVVPVRARGVVIFAHGSGSGRHSSRNRAVAHFLQEGGLATLEFDLLTEEEEQVDRYTREHRFDIPLLAARLVLVTQWLKTQGETDRLPIGYFGASTGAGAALIAAARLGEKISAVVSRGGRPDLAGETLRHVRAPTLLLVGEHDPEVIVLNREAYAELRSEKQLLIVPRATHLFEEPGALEAVARISRDWFIDHLMPLEPHAPLF
jgi:putative phosphoribosyl transferase